MGQLCAHSLCIKYSVSLPWHCSMLGMISDTALKELICSILHRHFRGEDLDSLSLKDLQSLEHQLDSALKHIRTRKVHTLYSSYNQCPIHSLG